MGDNRPKSGKTRKVSEKSLANLTPGGPGRKKIPAEVRQLFEAALPEVAAKLVDTALHSTNEELAYKAQVTLIERILGKPQQSVDVDMQGQMQIVINGAVKEWGV